jgi:hypothetical protein
MYIGIGGLEGKKFDAIKVVLTSGVKEHKNNYVNDNGSHKGNYL